MTRDEFLSRWALEADGVGSAFRVDIDALLAAERAKALEEAAQAVDGYGNGWFGVTKAAAKRIRALAEEARRG